MKAVTIGLALVLVVFQNEKCRAEKIEFPDEELASESVLPVFDKVAVVKNRNVVTAKKFEFGGGLGMNLMDPFYNPFNYNLSLAYHFDEVHGINLASAIWNDGLSTYGEQLRNGEGLSGDFFDPSRAPHPKSIVMGNYQYTAYYGKISLSKKAVMNLSMFALAGLGSISFGDQNSIALNFGFGEKFYFTPYLALRLDLRMLVFRGPDPTSLRLIPTDVVRSSSEFEETTYFQTLMTLGLVFLI
ncbi:MAG: outer membrane beta-barrel domain-containing protein [Bdellovibrionales bacterium]|nr:outer membrane beta-barrel domain-containing protein [Bdellovibrionales bacterium]